jgi:hypothetical protein
MTMNAGAVFTPPSNLPFQHFHFGRILYQIGHSVFPVEAQRHFHEAMDGPVLIIRQPFGLVIQSSQVVRSLSQWSAPTILFLATEHYVICLSVFGREYRLNPAILDATCGLTRGRSEDAAVRRCRIPGYYTDGIGGVGLRTWY